MIIDFTQLILSPKSLDKTLDFFLHSDTGASLIPRIQAELAELRQQILNFLGLDSDNAAYLDYLHKIVQVTHALTEEADLLDQVVPMWQKERGKSFSVEKPIDEFYAELEFFRLWLLIVNGVEHGFSPELTGRMRKIIRRYSNMPAMWLYLCALSGDQVSSVYTF